MEELIYGGKFALEVNLLFLLCFTLYLRAIFQVQARGGGLYLEGRFNGEFLVLPVWRLIFGEAYTWRGLFSEFCGIQDLTSLAG